MSTKTKGEVGRIESDVKRGYAASETEVRKHAPKATIGGAYALPKGYRPPVK